MEASTTSPSQGCNLETLLSLYLQLESTGIASRDLVHLRSAGSSATDDKLSLASNLCWDMLFFCFLVQIRLTTNQVHLAFSIWHGLRLRFKFRTIAIDLRGMCDSACGMW